MHFIMIWRVDLFYGFVLCIQILCLSVPKRDNLIIMVLICVNLPCITRGKLREASSACKGVCAAYIQLLASTRGSVRSLYKEKV